MIGRVLFDGDLCVILRDQSICTLYKRIVCFLETSPNHCLSSRHTAIRLWLHSLSFFSLFFAKKNYSSHYMCSQSILRNVSFSFVIQNRAKINFQRNKRRSNRGNKDQLRHDNDDIRGTAVLNDRMARVHPWSSSIPQYHRPVGWCGTVDHRFLLPIVTIIVTNRVDFWFHILSLHFSLFSPFN